MADGTHRERPPIAIVVAMGRKTRVIGRDNELVWHIPDDLKRFASLTRGKPVIMGRKTFESIVALIGKPLPGRTNIVVTRDPAYAHPGAIVVGTIEAALATAASENPEEIHIGGGGEIYSAVLPLVDRLYVTMIDDDAPGDAYFPAYDHAFSETARHGLRTYDGLTYEWVDLVRNTH